MALHNQNNGWLTLNTLPYLGGGARSLHLLQCSISRVHDLTEWSPFRSTKLRIVGLWKPSWKVDENDGEQQEDGSDRRMLVQKRQEEAEWAEAIRMIKSMIQDLKPLDSFK